MSLTAISSSISGASIDDICSLLQSLFCHSSLSTRFAMYHGSSEAALAELHDGIDAECCLDVDMAECVKDANCDCMVAELSSGDTGCGLEAEV